MGAGAGSGASTGLPAPAQGKPPVVAPVLTPSGATPVTPAAPTGAGGPPPFIITNRAETPVLPYIKLLVYAEYGVGKTWLCGTASDVPEMNDVFVMSAESGDLTLIDDSGQHAFNKIDIARARDYKQLARMYDFLKVHCMLRDLKDTPKSIAAAGGLTADQRLFNLQKRVMPDLKQEHRIRRYRTVILDSLTEAEIYCMNQLLGMTEQTAIDEELAGAEWAQYRAQHGMVQRLIRNLRDLPMNVLFTCARKAKEDEAKRSIYGPDMTGKLSGQVQGFMDMVGYLVIGVSTEEGQPAPRRLYIQPQPRFAAKSRFTNFRGSYIDNPTMPTILSTVGLLKSKAT